jgi:hypothetical protein
MIGLTLDRRLLALRSSSDTPFLAGAAIIIQSIYSGESGLILLSGAKLSPSEGQVLFISRLYS